MPRARLIDLRWGGEAHEIRTIHRSLASEKPFLKSFAGPFWRFGQLSPSVDEGGRYQVSNWPLCTLVCFLQDTKKGKLRFYHGPIFWNYGYIPQTWEDPNVKHPEASHARAEREMCVSR